MAAAHAVALATGTGDVTAHSGAIRLMGWSIAESAVTAAVATVIIRDGTSTAGPIVAVIELAANASDSEFFGPDGLLMGTGVFVDRTAGETQGAVYIA
jgi:hypothetical protein